MWACSVGEGCERRRWTGGQSTYATVVTCWRGHNDGALHTYGGRARRSSVTSKPGLSSSHGIAVDSSVVSKYTTPLYMRPLALHWLSALYIALCRLPIALIWLPTTRFFISRAPNLLTRLDVELQPPALAPSPTYRPALAPYRLPASGSTSRVPIKVF